MFAQTKKFRGPMFASAFFCAVLCIMSSKAQAFGAVEFHVQPWSDHCSPVLANQPQSCAEPSALAPEIVLQLDPRATTQTAFTSQPWAVDTRMSGELTVFAVPAASALPAYVQIRVEIIQPTRALCMTSQKWDGGVPLVPIICVGLDSQTLIQSGVTITGTLESASR